MDTVSLLEPLDGKISMQDGDMSVCILSQNKLDKSF